MALVINTNFAATTAANHLAAANQHLRRSLNRLSSGSKIVSPADDAGGLAVSMKLSAAAKRQGAAMINISNSVSYLQTQDGALKVAGKVLDRMSELKTLSLDPTKGSSDVANYNTEFNALKSQLTSLAAETFNGVALFGSSTLEVATTESGGGVVDVGGIDLLGAGGVSPDTIVLGPDGTQTFTPSSAGTLSWAATGSDSLDVDIPAGGAAAFSLGDGQSATYDGAGTWTFSSFNFAGTSATITASNLFGSTGGTVTFTPSGGGSGGNVSDVAGAADLGSLDLSTITDAIADVATHRATNGAQQSQLGFAAELLTVNKANLEAANSRIIDVDVAAEATQLARFSILVQSATSILAQANLSTQAALRLLG